VTLCLKHFMLLVAAALGATAPPLLTVGGAPAAASAPNAARVVGAAGELAVILASSCKFCLFVAISTRTIKP
jgi:hypothetical protein